MEYGITGFGAYVPRLRLDRAVIAAEHRWMAPALKGLARGTRAFCSWDEDAVTMAVEAARDALGDRPRRCIRTLQLASTTFPYADLQNSSIVAAALDLEPALRTADGGGSQRAATTMLAQALTAGDGEVLLIASDRPLGKPASTQEMTYGAGAAALTLGGEGVIARCLGTASISAMFVDHFRASGQRYDYFWEERWIRDEGYLALVPQAVGAALGKAGIGIGAITHLVMASPLRGIADAVGKKIGFASKPADALDDGCGYAGAAHPLLMLAAVLERCRPGERILLVGFGQGCDALVLEATDAIADFKPRRGVAAVLADAVKTDAYLRMLSFQGSIELEWGMRGEKEVKTAQTDQYRSAGQIMAFNAGKCRACGAVQFPQLAYCVNPACCAPAAQFDPFTLVDSPAAVLTYTADWPSYHPAPPLYVGFVQFAVGARLLMEMVDIGPAGINVGMPLRTVFRIKDRDTQRGYDRYFWKATPVAAG